MAGREQVLKQMQKDGIEYILAQFVDIHGVAKVKMVPLASFDDMVDVGAGFAGAAVWGVGQGPHSHDMLARIDLDSYTPLPWQPNTARFAADIFVDGKSYPYCARTNLKRVLAQVRKKGYAFNPNKVVLKFRVQAKARFTGTIAKGRYKVFVWSMGASTAQPIWMKRDSKGRWKAQNYSSIKANCQKPLVKWNAKAPSKAPKFKNPDDDL